jgi:hypothetical protein
MLPFIGGRSAEPDKAKLSPERMLCFEKVTLDLFDCHRRSLGISPEQTSLLRIPFHKI